MTPSCHSLRNSSLITVSFNRTVIKKEEKIDKKEEKRPEDIKKEEKDEDELKPGPTDRSRVTKSGEASFTCPRAGRSLGTGLGGCWSTWARPAFGGSQGSGVPGGEAAAGLSPRHQAPGGVRAAGSGPGCASPESLAEESAGCAGGGGLAPCR